MAGTGPIRYGVIGSGYRARAFVRVAERLPDRFSLAGVVTRTTTRADEVVETWGVPAYSNVEDLLADDSVDFVVTSTPFSVTPVLIERLVSLGVAVLAETPPAPDRESLVRLWERVGDSGLVQVAEQYPFAPGNVARKALLETGALGQTTWAYVSSTQQYHAVALVRQMLGVGFTPARVSAQIFRLPLVDPQTRAGWSDDLAPVVRPTTHATLDFGDRVGVYDYTANQARNPIRGNRMVVRGTRGELVDDHVTRLVAPRTPLESELRRWRTGEYLSFEEPDLYLIGDGERVLYRNPYFGARLSEEDIAVATLLERTGQWRRAGQRERADAAPPYPLAEAAQDQLLALAVSESVDTGRPVEVEPGPWSS